MYVEAIAVNSVKCEWGRDLLLSPCSHHHH